MSQLHLIQTQFNLADFSRLHARLANKNDNLLFLNDGILSLLSVEFNSTQFKEITAESSILVLKEQLEARAIDKVIDNELIKNISYEEFVDYSLKSKKMVSW